MKQKFLPWVASTLNKIGVDVSHITWGNGRLSAYDLTGLVEREGTSKPRFILLLEPIKHSPPCKNCSTLS